MSGQSAASLRKRPAAPPPVKRIFSWGRYPKITHHFVHKPAWNDQVPEILKAAAPGSLLPYGLGRSYGDSCLNAGRELIDCCRLDRILGFDEATAPASSPSGELLPMMFTEKTITAPELSALTFARSVCIARTMVL